MLSLGALGSGLLVMVKLFGWWWWFRQGVKGLAFEPNQLQGVYLSLVHVLVLIKSSWDNIPDSAPHACVGVHAVTRPRPKVTQHMCGPYISYIARTLEFK